MRYELDSALMQKGLTIFVALQVVAAIACNSDALPRSAAQTWCDGLCTAQQRCGDSRTGEECSDACVADRHGLATLNLAGATVIGQCIAMFDCTTLFDDKAWFAATTVCDERAQTAVPPTEHLRTFCQEYERAWFECYSWESTEKCETEFSTWADGPIEELTACTTLRTCDDFEACVSRVFRQ